MKISRTLRSVLVFAGVITCAVLSWIGFGKLHPGNDGFPYTVERFFRVLKSLLGEAIGNAVENKNLPWELVVAKILVTLIVLGGVFKIIKTIFFEQYTLLNVLLRRRHIISVGLGEKGIRILKDLKKCHQTTGVAIEKEKDHDNSGPARRHGHSVLFGDATSKEVLVESGIRRAKNFICFLENEQTTLEIAKNIHEIYSKKQINNHLECFLHLDNARLIDMMQGSQILQNRSNLNFRFFNRHRMIARNFFTNFAEDYQREISQNKNFKISIFGFSETSLQLLLQALRVLHFPNYLKLEIEIIDENSEKKSRLFKENYPKAEKIAAISFKKFEGFYSDFFKSKTDANTENVIIFGYEQDRDNLAAALEIQNLTPTENFRIYTLNTNSDSMNALLKNGGEMRIHFFGNLDYVCRTELITREKQDSIAMACHNDYLKLQKMVASESAAYKTPWEDLSEDAKNANRAQADHIIYKLAALGKNLHSIGNLNFTDEETEILAKTEHERWNAHRYLNGWDFGEKRDDLLKLHPSLVPWEKLPESEKQKDRDTILRLPKILENVKTLEI